MNVLSLVAFVRPFVSGLSVLVLRAFLAVGLFRAATSEANRSAAAAAAGAAAGSSLGSVTPMSEISVQNSLLTPLVPSAASLANGTTNPMPSPGLSTVSSLCS